MSKALGSGTGGIDFAALRPSGMQLRRVFSKPLPAAGALPSAVRGALRVLENIDSLRSPILRALELRSHPIFACGDGEHLASQDGGGGGIRTHGRFPDSGFQDRRNRPLYHPSVGKLKTVAEVDMHPLGQEIKEISDHGDVEIYERDERAFATS